MLSYEHEDSTKGFQSLLPPRSFLVEVGKCDGLLLTGDRLYFAFWFIEFDVIVIAPGLLTFVADVECLPGKLFVGT